MDLQTKEILREFVGNSDLLTSVALSNLLASPKTKDQPSKYFAKRTSRFCRQQQHPTSIALSNLLASSKTKDQPPRYFTKEILQKPRDNLQNILQNNSNENLYATAISSIALSNPLASPKPSKYFAKRTPRICRQQQYPLLLSATYWHLQKQRNSFPRYFVK